MTPESIRGREIIESTLPRTGREAEAHLCCLEARQLVFSAKLQGDSYGRARRFYREHCHALVLSIDGTKQGIRDEALRRFGLDVAVAEHFNDLGILPQLKDLEAKEIEHLKLGEPVSIVNPRLATLIRETKSLNSTPHKS